MYKTKLTDCIHYAAPDLIFDSRKLCIEYFKKSVGKALKGIKSKNIYWRSKPEIIEQMEFDTRKKIYKTYFRFTVINNHSFF
jgi:hypothetical protein